MHLCGCFFECGYFSWANDPCSSGELFHLKIEKDVDCRLLVPLAAISSQYVLSSCVPVLETRLFALVVVLFTFLCLRGLYLFLPIFTRFHLDLNQKAALYPMGNISKMCFRASPTASVIRLLSNPFGVAQISNCMFHRPAGRLRCSRVFRFEIVRCDASSFVIQLLGTWEEILCHCLAFLGCAWYFLSYRYVLIKQMLN